MQHLLWERHPNLRRPVVILAFEGWNDAGDAATLAVEYLAEEWGAERFASIDPEDFYDFTQVRPQVRVTEGSDKEIEWPEVELLSASVPGTNRDVVLIKGVEPQLRWRTFCSCIVQALRPLEPEMALMLGALLADVPHTRPVRVSGSSEDLELASALGVPNGNSYEGPTGILGVLGHSLSQAGIPTASFWASVPHYVQQVPSPPAALALLQRSAGVIGAHISPLEIQVAASEYVQQVSERVADDEDATAYVAELEAADDHDEPAPVPRADSEALTNEVERFLREQSDNS